LLGLRMRVIRSRNCSHRGGGHRQPGDRASLSKQPVPWSPP
jgi:hypothetical protein